MQAAISSTGTPRRRAWAWIGAANQSRSTRSIAASCAGPPGMAPRSVTTPAAVSDHKAPPPNRACGRASAASAAGASRAVGSVPVAATSRSAATARRCAAASPGRFGPSRSRAQTCGPAMPSTTSPQARWKASTASAVRGPNSPSAARTLPPTAAGQPPACRRDCSHSTSGPRSIGRARRRKRVSAGTSRIAVMGSHGSCAGGRGRRQAGQPGRPPGMRRARRPGCRSGPPRPAPAAPG